MELVEGGTLLRAIPEGGLPPERFLDLSVQLADEIYVETFPERGNKERFSLNGSQWPRWGPAGTELYYVSGDGMFIVDRSRAK